MQVLFVYKVVVSFPRHKAEGSDTPNDSNEAIRRTKNERMDVSERLPKTKWMIHE
jgi:hypothetical protein